MEKNFLKKLWPGWCQSRTELTENFTTRNVKVRGEKRIQDCGWWRLNKQTEERRRRRQRINKILDWILDCLQLLNLTLEDTYNCFSHLPNQYCELGPNCAVHKTAQEKLMRPRYNDIFVLTHSLPLCHILVSFHKNTELRIFFLLWFPSVPSVNTPD